MTEQKLVSYRVMIVVIIAGGSGTRLWPLSTPDYPKHLLKVGGDELSLLQNTYKRAKRLTDKIYVVSETGHIDHVRSQLPELGDEAFVVEPARRGTASCIVAALVHIAKQANPDEPVAILSADHYIRDLDGFVHSFKIASETSKQTSRIVLVGVERAAPETCMARIRHDVRILECPLERTGLRVVRSVIGIELDTQVLLDAAHGEVHRDLEGEPALREAL